MDILENEQEATRLSKSILRAYLSLDRLDGGPYPQDPALIDRINDYLAAHE